MTPDADRQLGIVLNGKIYMSVHQSYTMYDKYLFHFIAQKNRKSE